MFYTVLSMAQSVITMSSTSSSAGSSSLSEATNIAVIKDPIPVSDNSTTSGEEAKPIGCTPGNSVGYMLIRKPNITSMLTVGTPYNISWDWSISVTKPPVYLDAYIQLMAPGVRTTWKQEIAKKIPVEPRWFMWTPDGLLDGKYKIRLVPDGKETFNVAANLQPCFENGASIPSVSASFSMSNPRGDLSNYPDQFPPNSSGPILISPSSMYLYVLIVSILFMTTLTSN